MISILDRFSNVRVLVIGDFVLDEFAFGEISRVSREAPVLILKYQESKFCPGGAANTVANVASLGATAVPVGVLGKDVWAETLCSLWPSSVDTSNVLKDENSQTTRKVRITAGSFHSFRQQVVRMDYEHPLVLSPSLEEALLSRLEACLPNVDAVIVSDYSLGTLTPGLRTAVIQITRRSNLPVIVDSRDNLAMFPGATTVTPNITEVEAALQTRLGTQLDLLERAADQILSDWKLDALLVTRGKLGMSLFSKEGCTHIPPYGSDEAVDVTGAGDTVAATYATALAAGASFVDAAQLANLAGGLVVMKKGTATISPNELATALRSCQEELD